MIQFSPTKPFLEQLPPRAPGSEYIRIHTPEGFLIEEIEATTGKLICQVMRGKLKDLSPIDFRDLNGCVRITNRLSP